MTHDVAAPDKPALRRKGRPNLGQVADIDRAIRDAALQALMEHGEAATLNAIAQAAGISRKSLYARYASKSDLFIDVIRDLINQPDGMDCNASGPFDRQLHAFIRRMLDVVTARKSLTIQRLLAIDPAYIRVLRPEMRASSNRLFLQPLKDLMVAAAARGEIVPLDAEATARAIIVLVFAESHSLDPDRAVGRRGDWQNSHARFLTDFVCKGLWPRPAE